MTVMPLILDTARDSDHEAEAAPTADLSPTHPALARVSPGAPVPL
jgi:hypothetical protein